MRGTGMEDASAVNRSKQGRGDRTKGGVVGVAIGSGRGGEREDGTTRGVAAYAIRLPAAQCVNLLIIDILRLIVVKIIYHCCLNWAALWY